MEEPSVADKEVSSKQLTEIYTRLGNLQQHIVNLIHPIQCLNRLVGGPEKVLNNFIHLFKDPIKIDDREIVKSMNEFKASMDIYSEQMNLKALIDTFMTINKIQYALERIENKFNERMSNMEKVLCRLDTEGLQVKFSVNERPIPEPIKKKGKK